MIRELPIDQIDGRSDARQIDEATVGGLVDSIGTVGLINPIRVRAVADRWEVIAGHHRLTACKRLGLVEIAADVIESDDLHAELAMIDENLCRADLTPAERAAHMARRKAIYLELHPETRHGANLSKSFQDENTDRAEGFASKTAEATGRSMPSVWRDTSRGEKVIAEALGMIQGTKLDTGTYLDKIKGLRPNEQVAAVRRDLQHLRQQEREKARNGISRRVAALDVDEVREKQVAALMAAWNKASEEARAEFLAAIDTPVFDRSAA
jgi:hypothetical protein